MHPLTHGACLRTYLCTQDRRPNTSGGPPPVASTGSGTSRFSRLACSMDAGGPSPRPGSRQGMLHRSLPEGCMQQVMAYEQQRLHALSAHGSATGPRKQPAHAEGQQDQPGMQQTRQTCTNAADGNVEPSVYAAVLFQTHDKGKVCASFQVSGSSCPSNGLMLVHLAHFGCLLSFHADADRVWLDM